MAGNAPNIIIKKIKKVQGGGHHGGAWKVAYADFVTAMMAFFLLMWLLNATSEDTKKGLADYFDNRIPIAQISGGGTSAFSGDSVTVKGAKAESGKEEQARPTGGAAGVADAQAQAENATGGEATEARALAMIEAAFESLSGESDAEREMLRHIRTRVTRDGLVIDIFDTDGAPLFERGSSTPTPMLRALVEVVASVAQLVTNDVSLTGHTDAAAFSKGGDDGNWSLSSDRAHTARRLMIESGLDAGRIAEVSGKAATQPVAEDPLDPRNRRVEITLLRGLGGASGASAATPHGGPPAAAKAGETAPPAAESGH